MAEHGRMNSLGVREFLAEGIHAVASGHCAVAESWPWTGAVPETDAAPPLHCVL